MKQRDERTGRLVPVVRGRGSLRAWHYNDQMARTKLGRDELTAALERLNRWSLQNEKLHREYRFPDFAHAFGFMATAAVLIEKLNHHPEWSNVYNRVSVDLTTHDAGGVTQRDLELAELLEGIASKLSS